MQFAPLLLSALLSVQPLEPGDHVRRLEVGDRSRSYHVYVPTNYSPERPTPVVLIFHGLSMNARMMANLTGMNDKAESAGFVAVYPNGTGPTKRSLTFNGGGSPDSETMPNDVEFTVRILDDLETVLNVDKKRVFATGFSAGGMMCYRLAAELPNRIAAIAPVAGTIAIDPFQLKRPVPVIHFHGTSDTFVPWTGPGERMYSSYKSVDETIRLSAAADGCPPVPVTTELPAEADDLPVTRQEYGPGRDGAEVILFKVHGGGHTWPGRARLSLVLGASTQSISANDLIWEFFEKHPLK